MDKKRIIINKLNVFYKYTLCRMINFIKRFLGKQKLKAINMTIYEYKRGDKVYIIPCEHFLYGKPDITLHKEDIHYFEDKEENLSDSLKAEIADEVKKELESQGVKVIILPS